MTDAQREVNAYWNGNGESYDRQERHGLSRAAEAEVWRALLPPLLPPPPAEILDAGTSTGFLALLLAELGHRVTGIDPAEGMLARARSKAARMPNPPSFQLGDAHAPRFSSESFHLVVSRHLLWTLSDPAAAFAAWWRILRPGGRVLAFDGLWFLSEPAESVDELAAPRQAAWRRHYHDQTRAQLPLMDAGSFEPAIALLESAGFHEVGLTRLDALERELQQHATDTEWQPEPRYLLSGLRPL